MSDSTDSNQTLDSNKSGAGESVRERPTNLMLELGDLIARNPQDWPSLKSKLEALGERDEDPPSPAPGKIRLSRLAKENADAIQPPIPASGGVSRKPLPVGGPATTPTTDKGSLRVAAPVPRTSRALPDSEPAADASVPGSKKRKRGFWAKIGGGSLMFATGFHIVLLIIGAFWIFQIIQEPEKKVDFMPPGGGGGERGAEKVAVKKMKQITPTTNVKRVFAEGVQSSYAIPEQGDNFGEMSPLSSLSGGGMSGLGGSGTGSGFGKGSGTGGGLGTGGGAGKLFGLIPDTMRKRCSKEDRLLRLKENGGTPACEDAVLKSLRWLKSIQNPDGSWGEDQPADLCGKPAMTGFALLAYLGHCETPASEEFGESCMRGIVYLVDLGMKKGGKLSTNLAEGHWCYEQAVATYALGEASTFCTQLKMTVPNLMEVTAQAGQFIIDNQNKNGGWAYSYATEGGHTDVSVSGWQIQALRACSHNRSVRLKGLATSIGKGLRYLGTCQNANGGVGYAGLASGNPNYFTLTGVAVLCNQMWGKGSNSDVNKGIKYITANTKFDYTSENSDLYQHYYESQAMMYAGGAEWKHYNEVFRDQILNNQNADGSWKPPGSGNNAMLYGKNSLNGKIYRSVLCTLMLEVYYRFLATGGSSTPGI